MKKLIIGVIAFAAGAGIGTGVTYAICKSKLEKKYNKLERKLHRQYDIMMKRLDQAPAVDISDNVIKESTWMERDISNMSNDDQKAFYMQKIRDLGYSVGEYDVDEDDEVNPIDDEDEEDDAPEELSEEISILSYNEFIHLDNTDLKSISLTYYAGDKTITDDKDTIIPEWRSLIGDEWIGIINAKNHTCFVLNREAGIVADVEYIEGSYKEIVEGKSSEEA